MLPSLPPPQAQAALHFGCTGGRVSTLPDYLHSSSLSSYPASARMRFFDWKRDVSLSRLKPSHCPSLSQREDLSLCPLQPPSGLKPSVAQCFLQPQALCTYCPAFFLQLLSPHPLGSAETRLPQPKHCLASLRKLNPTDTWSPGATGPPLPSPSSQLASSHLMVR